MGAAIAHCAAIGGIRVVLIDLCASALDRAMRAIARDERLLRLMRRPAMGDGVGSGEWISPTTDMAVLREARFVIECVPERLDIKEALYRQMDALCLPDAVFATVTSAIPIARVGSWTRRPDRVIGVHFMNPAQWKDAVEVVCGEATSGPTLAATEALLAALGKKAIPAQDGPGFTINRILMPFINDAARLVGEGRCTPAVVDRLFRECLGHRGGPLETADLIGIDNVVDTLRILWGCIGDRRFLPCARLEDMVADGRLGRKTGRGFYEHPEV